MSSTNLGKVETIQLENRLLLAFDQEWMKVNNNQPLIFDVKIDNGKLVLEAQIAQ